jgi:hypothetical protein
VEVTNGRQRENESTLVFVVCGHTRDGAIRYHVGRHSRTHRQGSGHLCNSVNGAPKKQNSQRARNQRAHTHHAHTHPPVSARVPLEAHVCIKHMPHDTSSRAAAQHGRPRACRHLRVETNPHCNHGSSCVKRCHTLHSPNDFEANGAFVMPQQPWRERVNEPIHRNARWCHR